MNKILLNTFGAVALVTAAAGASAATYDITGTSSTTLPNGGSLGGFLPIPAGTQISAATATGSATGDVTSLSGAIQQDVTSSLDPGLHMLVDWDYVINGDSTGTRTFTGCTDLGGTLGCGSSGFTLGQSYALDVTALDFSNPNVLTWSTQDLAFNSTLNGNTLDVQSFTATIQAVPLPAAAWMFGSALLGLTGVSRRRRKA